MTEEQQQLPAAEGDDLDQRLDNLLDEVEALTDEVLADPPEPAADAPAEDPATQIARDDVGLSDQVVQDDNQQDTTELLADVDQELDEMERIIGNMGAAGPEATPDTAEVPDQPDPPESSPDALLEDDDIASLIPSDPLKISGAGTAKREENAEPVASEPAPAPAPAPPPAVEDVADETPPEEEAAEVSELENELESDLHALLSKKRMADDGPPTTAEPDQPPPATVDGPLPDDIKPDVAKSLESISIWRHVRLKVSARFARWGRAVVDRIVHVLVIVLDRADGPTSHLSPGTKELIGYCALGTLAMSVVALIVALLR
jgi:hypothetical protein